MTEPHFDHLAGPSRYGALKAENSRLLLEDVHRRAVVYRAMPEVIGLHTTEICNLRCIQCPRSIRQGRYVLPREDLRRLCDELFPTARKAILTAAAGEPMLADFELVLDRALAYEVRLDLITNGTMLTEAAYARAAPVLDHVNVSLDALDDHLYRRIRGGSLERVRSNLDAIAARRRQSQDDVLLTVSAVMLRSNLAHLPEFVRAAARFGVDGVIFQRLQHQALARRRSDHRPRARRHRSRDRPRLRRGT